VKLRIVGDAFGRRCEFSDMWIKEYDPHRLGVSPSGQEMNCYLEVTDHVWEAKRFRDASEALEYWRQENGVRADGEPNRPLTAFTVVVE
jgi:hypothetical protein